MQASLRCGLLFLACVVFMSFNLVSEQLWDIDAEKDEADSSQSQRSIGKAAGDVAGPGDSSSAELYKGKFEMHSNGTLILDGSLRMNVVAQHTSALSLRVSSISLALFDGPGGMSLSSNFGANDADFLLRAVEFSDLQRLTASGITDPNTFGLFGEHPCRLDAVLKVEDHFHAGAQLPHHEHAFTGEVRSIDCGFTMNFFADAIDIQQFGQKVVHYAIWVNLLTVIQIRCFLEQMRYTDEGPSVAKLSIVGIAVQALMDAYDSFLHLSLSASSRYMFNTFAIVSLFKFVLFALLEVRYLLTIWRHRHQDIFTEGWDAVRRELSRVYSRFYGVLILGLVLIFNSLEHLDIIALTFQAYWVPQILFDVRQGSKNALHPHFLLGISVTRCLALLYLWGCPSGIFSGDLYPRLPGSPNPRLCAAVVILQSAQVGLMVSQKVLGPRWFVPWLCLPHIYNYNRPVEVTGDAECVICMGELAGEDVQQQQAVTPCGHHFHHKCLERWMDVKMECPTCRAALPPMT